MNTCTHVKRRILVIKTPIPYSSSDTVQRWYLSLRTNGDIVVVGVSPGLLVSVVIVGPNGKVKAPRKLPAQWVQTETRWVWAETRWVWAETRWVWAETWCVWAETRWVWAETRWMWDKTRWV